MCRNLSDSLSEAGALFYLNGSELNPENYPRFSNQNDQPARLCTINILHGSKACKKSCKPVLVRFLQVLE
jgi:hypothetical protein